MSGGRITRRTNSGASSIRGSPGTSARITPAMTSRMDGAVLRRRATIATTTRTASMSSRIWIVSVMTSGNDRGQSAWRSSALRNRAGDDIHGERHDGGTEQEGENAVGDDHAANCLAGDRDIRHLERHSDHEGKIDEIPIVGLVVVGKFQALCVPPLAVERVGIVEREDGVGERP